MKKFIYKHYKLLILSTVIICVAVYGISAYVNDYYRAGNSSRQALISDETVTVENNTKNHTILFSCDNPSKGLIFYPGGKVEYEAYAPLLHTFAKNGFVCMVIRMPFNLAVFGKNSADKYIDSMREQYSTVQKWYVGGHSLGGAMAAAYACENADKIDGLILLAAYSTKDLRESGLDVYSIYGSNDKVMNHDKYNKYKTNLPDDTHEFVIDGGCHSFFGNYGHQKGDGNPDITMDEQIQSTIDFIISKKPADT